MGQPGFEPGPLVPNTMNEIQLLLQKLLEGFPPEIKEHDYSLGVPGTFVNAPRWCMVMVPLTRKLTSLSQEVFVCKNR